MIPRLRRYMVLALLSVAPMIHAAELQELQDLHEFRSDGYVTGTYVLIDNNLFERVREPGNRETYNNALKNMDQLLRKMGNPTELRRPYDALVALIRQLEGQSIEEAHYHLATVNQIMMAHAELDKAVAAEYDLLAKDAPEDLLALHRQSLETNQILLLYQNSMFSSIGVYFVEAKEGLFNEMDARITQRANELRELFPELNATFDQLEKQYEFIKPRLLDHRADWVPTIAAFYLLRNTSTLNNLSRDALNRDA
ncbi:hypothetical protein [Pseudomonas sp. OIL-1]|uniref:hypothetical protein n=1 Tax=Pseudomonas sp. OIL-1 TaxID=2706126 RepID=UPI0013A7A078|nr:hypothetical protein [Pseudomonas sp. OIL-1]QIB50819.1 hypothetical protein G3M63_06960 [Pseudomonas sp. OIL-1]